MSYKVIIQLNLSHISDILQNRMTDNIYVQKKHYKLTIEHTTKLETHILHQLLCSIAV